MSKFDLVFERACAWLNENSQPTTIADNILALVSVLSDRELLDKNKSPEQYIEKAKKTGEIILGEADPAIPTVMLKVRQTEEDFSVDVVDLTNPQQPKTFGNDMLETIFKKVADEVRAITLKNVSVDSAVEQLPQEDGAQAQPGAEQSALPKQQPTSPTV
jgi:hypothetical protein